MKIQLKANINGEWVIVSETDTDYSLDLDDLGIEVINKEGCKVCGEVLDTYDELYNHYDLNHNK